MASIEASARGPRFAFVTALPVVFYLVAGAVGRLVLFHCTTLPATLLDRMELASPLTSFRRLREGVFLFQRGMDPYNGGTFNHSPVYLSLFSTILPPTSPILISLAWSMADVMSAWSLVRIWRSRDESRAESRTGWDSLVAFVYLCHPYTLLTCLARSTSTFDNLLVLLSIDLASNSRPVPALSCLAVATLTSLYPILLLPLIIQLILKISIPASSVRSKRVAAGRLVAVFVVALAALLASQIPTLRRSGLPGAFTGWALLLNIEDLTPNVGLSWYFFTEMFDHFRPFFTGVFQLHLLIYVAPLAIAFKEEPLFALLCMQNVISTLKPYPTLGDSGLSLVMLPLFPEVVPHLRQPVVTIGLHVYSAILLPLLNHLWLGAGSANANFFYAVGLVFGLGNALGGVDLVWSGKKALFLREEKRLRLKEEDEGRAPLRDADEGKQQWEVVQVTR